MIEKTALTFDEVIKVAYLHHIRGTDQLTLSIAYNVNAGRISEACTVMKYASEHVLELYNQIGGAAANKRQPELKLSVPVVQQE